MFSEAVSFWLWCGVDVLVPVCMASQDVQFQQNCFMLFPPYSIQYYYYFPQGAGSRDCMFARLLTINMQDIIVQIASSYL